MKSDGKMQGGKGGDKENTGKKGGLNKEANAILNGLDDGISIDGGRSAYSKGSRRWLGI